MFEDEVRVPLSILSWLKVLSMICFANFINALFYLTEENIILMPIQVSFWEDWRCPDQWRREEGTELLDLKLEERNPRQSKIPRELREVPTARAGEGQKETPEISRDPHQQQGKSSCYFWAWKEFWGETQISNEIWLFLVEGCRVSNFHGFYLSSWEKLL